MQTRVTIKNIANNTETNMCLGFPFPKYNIAKAKSISGRAKSAARHNSHVSSTKKEYNSTQYLDIPNIIEKPTGTIPDIATDCSSKDVHTSIADQNESAFEVLPIADIAKAASIESSDSQSISIVCKNKYARVKPALIRKDMVFLEAIRGASWYKVIPQSIAFLKNPGHHTMTDIPNMFALKPYSSILYIGYIKRKPDKNIIRRVTDALPPMMGSLLGGILRYKWTKTATYLQKRCAYK